MRCASEVVALHRVGPNPKVSKYWEKDWSSASLILSMQRVISKLLRKKERKKQKKNF
jgi:hypothetical protein